MSEHINRMSNTFFGVIPKEGTHAFEKLKTKVEEDIANNPQLKKDHERRFMKAVNSLKIQDSNGINLNMDQEIRHFLREFNSRAWQYGIRSLPIMFNIMESFFDYNKSIIFFELLEEEDHLLSLFDFLDYYTSQDFDYSIAHAKEDLNENLIYNYNVGADLNELTFKIDNGKEFVIGGISIVRRRNEVTILLQTGQKTNTCEESKKLEELPKSRIPGKERLSPAEGLELEAVRLNNDANLWKNLIACRIDIDTQTIDARYIANDIGQAFQVITDEIDGFLSDDGEFINEELRITYENQIQLTEEYNSLFEFAKSCLFLPSYLNKFESEIYSEEHETTYVDLVKMPLEKRKYSNVDNKFKIRSRPLWILNRNTKFDSTRLTIKDDRISIQTSGFWRKLDSEEYGIDKKGKKISGKTWVHRKDSFYKASTNDLIVSNEKKIVFKGEKAGYVYVMRNPVFPKDTFKIGRTKNESSKRANQISKTSVPDKFYVIREWTVRDMFIAEKEIHDELNEYRVDPRREFFTASLEFINNTVEKIVERINNT